MGPYGSGALLLPVARIASRGAVIKALRAPNRMLSSSSSTCLL